MVGPGDCVDRRRRPVGLGHLLACQSPHNPEGGNGASRAHRGIGCLAQANCARPGNHPSWKCTTIHHRADLCPHQRVFEEVVRRHWRTRQARTTACRYRNSGSRPATPAGPQQPADREGKSRARLDNEIPVSGTLEKVYAPFDGVVTARNTDVGDLINSGSSGGVKTDLFHIAQPGKLRVYVNVPEEYSRGVKVGMAADLSLAEFPGRAFRGKLVRTADAITVTTRTLLIEIDVDNPTGTLLTGSYAEVHLKIPMQKSTLLLPVNTLIFRSQGLHVGIVKDGKVVLTAVTAGHDFGNEIEIVSGLKTDDQVIINPPDSIVHGQQVQIVQATLPGDTK